MERFLEAEEEGAPVDTRLQALIETVAGDGNPRWNRDSEPSDFNFEIMRPGRIFTMAGQQFRYLEDMGGGNHMIIRNQAIALGINWNNQETELNRWYNEDFLPDDSERRAQWEEYVAPVTATFNVGMLYFNSATRPVSGIITNLSSFPVPFADRTRAVPGGVRRAFALSVADVNHLTQTRSFFNVADRGTNVPWWLRTRSTANVAWIMHTPGTWTHGYHTHSSTGVRPALIIHQ